MFQEYDPGDFYDEMFSGPGEVRPHYGRLLQRAEALSVEDFDRKRQIAERSYLNQGITFTSTTTSRKARNAFFPSISSRASFPVTNGVTSSGVSNSVSTR